MRRARVVRIEWECDNEHYPSEHCDVLMCEDIAIAIDDYCEEVMPEHHGFIVTGEPSFEVEEEKG